MPPLVLIALAWLAGLLAAHHWLVSAGIKPLSLLLLCLIPIGGWLLWRKERSMRLASACALALLLAAFWYQNALPDFEDSGFVAHYNDMGWTTLEGVVESYPDERDTWTNLRLNAESIVIDGQKLPVQGAVQVRAPRYPQYAYGDRLRISGLLKTPPDLDDFSYRDYLARKGIHSYVNYPLIELLTFGQGSPFWAIIYAVRSHAADVIAELMPQPEASLLQGVLLGLKTAIPQDLYEEFNATGTSHVLVISGANITIVATLFALIFGRFLGKRRAYWLTLGGITLYVLFVGADAAVVRAGLMGALFLTALTLGRRSSAHVALLVSAMLLTFINPLALWDVGFQLSFAATLGLIVFVPLIESLFAGGLSQFTSRERAGQIIPLLSDVLVVTLAAQVLTTPLIIYHFGRFSLVAPLTNLLIMPVQMPIMVSGGSAAIVGLIPLLEPMAWVLFWIPWLFLAYTRVVVQWMASWPLASFDVGQVSTIWLAAYYLLISGLTLGLTWFINRRKRFALRIRTGTAPTGATRWVLALLLITLILVWLAMIQLPDGLLHVAFLDVGQGDAIFITTPSGQQILVDGGPSPAALTSALGSQMPFWDRSLDLLVLTHPDADHITGFAEVLDRYRVDGWLENGIADDSALYVECLELLEGKDIPRHTVRKGYRLELEQGIVLEVLNPPAELADHAAADSNDSSVVLRLSWGEASFLLTGDIEEAAERLILQSGQPLAVDVLKLAHHGSGGSSSAEFLAAVNPSYAVISAGIDNNYSHPDPSVLERLAQLGDVTVLRTDQQGSIEFSTDGHRLWVQKER